MILSFIKKKIWNFANLDKWRKKLKIQEIISTGFLVTGLVLTLVFYISTCFSSVQTYDGIEIDPEDDSQIILNFSSFDEMRVSIPFTIYNYDNFNSITDIKVSMDLKIDYYNLESKKDTEAKVFSKTKKLTEILPGKKLEFKIKADDGKDTAWDWGDISTFVFEADATEKIKVLIDLKIYLNTQSEKIWIIYEDIDLSEESTANYPIESSNKDTESKLSENIEQKIQIFKSRIHFVNLTYITIIFIILTAIIKRRDDEKSKDLTHLKKQNWENNIDLFLRFFMFLIFFIIWDVIIFFQLENENLNEVIAGDYKEQYLNTILISIIASSIIGFLVLFPAKYPNKVQQYSMRSSLFNLLIKLLLLFQIFIYAFYTSVISYEWDDATIIIDSFNILIFFTFILIIQFIFAVFSVFYILWHKNEFKKIRSREVRLIPQKKKYIQKALRDEDELDYLIYLAIQELGELASFKKIRTYFRNNYRKPIQTQTGQKLSTKYLQLLIQKGYLSHTVVDNQKDYPRSFYCLSEQARKFVKQYRKKFYF